MKRSKRIIFLMQRNYIKHKHGLSNGFYDLIFTILIP